MLKKNHVKGKRAEKKGLGEGKEVGHLALLN